VKRGRERKLEAYRDGALGESDRRRVERDLAQDLDAARYVKRSAALGSLIRDAWSEGPAAPSAERLLASIAPEMRRIDAERRPTSAAGRSLAALLSWLRDGRDVLSGGWLAAGGAVAAVCVAALLMVPRTMDSDASAYIPDAVARFVAPAPSVPVQLASDSAADTGPLFIGEMSWPSAVYDLAQEDAPLMVSEKNGAIVIFMGEPEPEPETGDDISSAHVLEDLA
jgi:anti-sigma factor RsiW